MSGARFEGLEARRLLAGMQFGEFLYFEHNDGVHGNELWKSDLDGSNAALVSDINPGAGGSNIMLAGMVRGKVHFATSAGTPAPQLWRTDGTPGGTEHIAALAPYAVPVLAGDGRLYFLRTVTTVSRTDGDGLVHDVFTASQNFYNSSLAPGPDGGVVYYGYTNPPTYNPHAIPGVPPVGAVSNGVLTISGTDQNDQIHLSSDGTNTTVTLNDYSDVFLNTSFTSIKVNGLEGDDRIELDATVLHSAQLYGDAGDDTITGGSGNDLLDGGLGTDEFDYSATQDDIVILNTKVTIGTAVDSMTGLERLLTGGGDDNINITTTGGSTAYLTYIDAGAGDDKIVFRPLAQSQIDPTVHGGAGNDEIFISGNHIRAHYFGDADNDVFTVHRSDGTSRDFHGGDGIDLLDFKEYNNISWSVRVSLDDIANDGALINITTYGAPGPDNVHSDIEVVKGGGGNDTLIGSAKGELLFGIHGQDIIDGGGGNDSLDGGPGDDTLIGRGGQDLFMGGDGNDYLFGIASEDSFDTDPGTNTILPYAPSASLIAGILRISGSSLMDRILVRQSDRNPAKLLIVGVTDEFDIASISQIIVQPGAGDDRVDISARLSLATKLYGDLGNDTLIGGSGADRMYGGDGNDWMSGGVGNDTMYGEAGNDRLFGGDGRDYLDGGAGADILRGEAGQDRLVVRVADGDDFKGNTGDILNLLA